MNKIVLTVAICVNCCMAHGGENLVSRVYEQAALALDAADGVKGGGFLQDGMSDAFVSFCSLVSNRCDDIVADWNAFETNATTRFTLISAVGFCGFQCQTNLLDQVLTLHESGTNSVSYSTVRLAGYPYGIPQDAEHFLALHYDEPGVSNLILRVRSAAVSFADTNTVSLCDECISGEQKREYLDMKAAGAL